jgi:DDE domain
MLFGCGQKRGSHARLEDAKAAFSRLTPRQGSAIKYPARFGVHATASTQVLIPRDMATLHRQGRRPDPSEIARLGLKAGLTPREILLEIQDCLEYRHTRSREISDALALFITWHCEQIKAKRVLEYASTPTLLTLGLTEHGEEPQLTYISPDPFAGALQELFKERLTQLIRVIPDVSHGAQFDAIICQPSLGYKPSGVEAADGFGGEVLMQLVPFLAQGGTIYWVTGRGVLFTPRAKKTALSHSAFAGLDLWGVISPMTKISYAGYRFPPETIQQAIWLYVRFTLSFRDVEDLLAERGIMVSYETVRRWVNHFGPKIAADLRKRRPKPHTTWHLDEVYLKIDGRMVYLWRAVDAEGEVLDVMVQSRRNKWAVA